MKCVIVGSIIKGEEGIFFSRSEPLKKNKQLSNHLLPTYNVGIAGKWGNSTHMHLWRKGILNVLNQ